jgi:hypothetical protein
MRCRRGDRFVPALGALAVSVAVPLTVVGGALVVLDGWMAVVEWRGRFAAKKTEEPVKNST